MEMIGKPSSDGGQGAPFVCTKPLMPMEAAVKVVFAQGSELLDVLELGIPDEAHSLDRGRRYGRIATRCSGWGRCRCP